MTTNSEEQEIKNIEQAKSIPELVMALKKFIEHHHLLDGDVKRAEETVRRYNEKTGT